MCIYIKIQQTSVLQIYIYIIIRTHTNLCVYIYRERCVDIRANMYICIYEYIHTPMYVYMYIYIYTFCYIFGIKFPYYQTPDQAPYSDSRSTAIGNLFPFRLTHVRLWIYHVLAHICNRYQLFTPRRDNSKGNIIDQLDTNRVYELI